MRTLKSVKHAISLSTGQLTAQQLINGRIRTKKGWESFKKTDELDKEVAKLVSELLGGWAQTKKKVFNSIYYGSPQHWGLRRIHFDKYKSQKDRRKNYIAISYFAGQDYSSELNIIRTAIK